MNHLILSDHTEHCYSRDVSLFHSHTIDNYIVFFNDEFYLLELCQCLRAGLNRGEFIQTVIDKKFKKTEIFHKWDVLRSYEADDRLRRIIKEGNLLTKMVHQCHFLYSSAARTYAVVSKSRLIDAYKTNNDKLIENHNEAISYLKKIDKEYLIKQVEELFQFNVRNPLHDSFCMCNTIKEFNNKLRKLIKNKKS